MTPDQLRLYREKYNAKAPNFQVGQRVRCHFGAEHRDGRVEYIAPVGVVHVRIHAGWVHKVWPDDVGTISSLEFIESRRGELPAVECVCDQRGYEGEKRCKQFCITGRVVGPAPAVPARDLGMWS